MFSKMDISSSLKTVKFSANAELKEACDANVTNEEFVHFELANLRKYLRFGKSSRFITNKRLF